MTSGPLWCPLHACQSRKSVCAPAFRVRHMRPGGSRFRKGGLGRASVTRPGGCYFEYQLVTLFERVLCQTMLPRAGRKIQARTSQNAKRVLTANAFLVAMKASGSGQGVLPCSPFGRLRSRSRVWQVVQGRLAWQVFQGFPEWQASLVWPVWHPPPGSPRRPDRQRQAKQQWD